MAARHRRKTARRFTAWTWSQASSVISCTPGPRLDAGVVDQDVQAAEGPDGAADDLGGRRPRPPRPRPAPRYARPLEGRNQRPGRSTASTRAPPSWREQLRARPPDARGGAGDESPPCPANLGHRSASHLAKPADKRQVSPRTRPIFFARWPFDQAHVHFLLRRPGDSPARRSRPTGATTTRRWWRA